MLNIDQGLAGDDLILHVMRLGLRRITWFLLVFDIRVSMSGFRSWSSLRMARKKNSLCLIPTFAKDMMFVDEVDMSYSFFFYSQALKIPMISFHVGWSGQGEQSNGDTNLSTSFTGVGLICLCIKSFNINKTRLASKSKEYDPLVLDMTHLLKSPWWGRYMPYYSPLWWGWPFFYTSLGEYFDEWCLCGVFSFTTLFC